MRRALRLPLGSSSINYIRSTRNFATQPSVLRDAGQSLKSHYSRMPICVRPFLRGSSPRRRVLEKAGERLQRNRGEEKARERERRREGGKISAPAVVMALMTVWLKGNSRINSGRRNEKANVQTTTTTRSMYINVSASAGFFRSPVLLDFELFRALQVLSRPTHPLSI